MMVSLTTPLSASSFGITSTDGSRVLPGLRHHCRLVLVLPDRGFRRLCLQLKAAVASPLFFIS
jgi:hypothetical protein